MSRDTEAWQRIQLSVALPPRHSFTTEQLLVLARAWRRQWLARKPTGTILNHWYAGISALAFGHGRDGELSSLEEAVFSGHTNFPLKNLGASKELELELQSLAEEVGKLMPDTNILVWHVEIHNQFWVGVGTPQILKTGS